MITTGTTPATVYVRVLSPGRAEVDGIPAIGPDGFEGGGFSGLLRREGRDLVGDLTEVPGALAGRIDRRVSGERSYRAAARRMARRAGWGGQPFKITVLRAH